MNIDDLTIGHAKQLSQLFNGNNGDNAGLNDDIGKYVIIRTYSAGVHCGVLYKKSGNEVILKESRRMHYWICKQSISLSSVAKYGLDDTHSDNRICDQIKSIWLEAIEIIPTTTEAENSLRGIKVVEAR